MRWRRGIAGVNETSSSRFSTHSRVVERKSLASVYIMCRALISVLSAVSVSGLTDTLGYSLEETIFEQFKSPIATSHTNYRLCAELYATVLGCLARLRLVYIFLPSLSFSYK